MAITKTKQQLWLADQNQSWTDHLSTERGLYHWATLPPTKDQKQDCTFFHLELKLSRSFCHIFPILGGQRFSFLHVDSIAHHIIQVLLPRHKIILSILDKQTTEINKC